MTVNERLEHYIDEMCLHENFIYLENHELNERGITKLSIFVDTLLVVTDITRNDINNYILNEYGYNLESYI